MAELHDSFGESMEKAGYERASDSDSSFSGGGGWREDNSSDSYRSTSDRWNDHKSRYGKDKVYTDAFNERRNNSSWRGGHSAISRTISEKYHSLSNGQMSAAVPEKDQKTLTGGLFGKSYSNAPYSERTPSIFDRNIRGSMTLNNGDAWSSDPQYLSVRDQATINSHDRLKRGEELNLIGRAVGGVSSGVGGVATTLGGAIAEGAANLGLSHVGDLSRQFKSNQEQAYYDSLTPEGKAYYDTRVDFIDKSYKNAREKYETNDKWIDRGITAAQVGLSTLGPPGAMLASGIGLLGKAINKKDTMTKSLRDLTETLNSNALNNHIAQQNELAKKERQAYKEFMAGRNLRSDNTQPKGILNTMHNRMQNIEPDKQVKTNDVPNLRNYWANIIVS
ncbi:TPA: hypothetical protein ACPJ9D_001675 [Haemophilus influenzae]|uniref:hypothetical protein n=1 Tax=Haemophilus influenzae TaxID=727 RepID=UPI001EF87EB3|nr:hypothetical protein [Haemophilus influenzae]MDO7266142.1 hypothetical protein [Haemophilus influenzae]